MCVPARLLLAQASTMASFNFVLRLFFAVVAAVMIFLWYFHLRQHAPEAGGRTWWNWLRPLHALMYAAFSATGRSEILFADVAIGVVASLAHHRKK